MYNGIVICIDTWDEDCFTENKIYCVKNGFIVDDLGHKIGYKNGIAVFGNAQRGFETLKELQEKIHLADFIELTAYETRG